MIWFHYITYVTKEFSRKKLSNSKSWIFSVKSQYDLISLHYICKQRIFTKKNCQILKVAFFPSNSNSQCLFWFNKITKLFSREKLCINFLQLFVDLFQTFFLLNCRTRYHPQEIEDSHRNFAFHQTKRRKGQQGQRRKEKRRNRQNGLVKGHFRRQWGRRLRWRLWRFHVTQNTTIS